MPSPASTGLGCSIDGFAEKHEHLGGSDESCQQCQGHYRKIDEAPDGVEGAIPHAPNHRAGNGLKRRTYTHTQVEQNRKNDGC